MNTSTIPKNTIIPKHSYVSTGMMDESKQTLFLNIFYNNFIVSRKSTKEKLKINFSYKQVIILLICETILPQEVAIVR